MRARIDVVVFGEETAGRGLEPERAEHGSRDVVAGGLFHFGVGPVSEIDAVSIRDSEEVRLILYGGAHTLEQRILGAFPESVVAWGVESLPAEDVEAFRRSDRQGAEEHGVDQAECGGARADGEGEREDGRGGGDLVLAELAPAEDSVGAQ